MNWKKPSWKEAKQLQNRNQVQQHRDLTLEVNEEHVESQRKWIRGLLYIAVLPVCVKAGRLFFYHRTDSLCFPACCKNHWWGQICVSNRCMHVSQHSSTSLVGLLFFFSPSMCRNISWDCLHSPTHGFLCPHLCWSQFYFILQLWVKTKTKKEQRYSLRVTSR